MVGLKVVMMSISSKWEGKTSVIKGDFAEEICKNYLESFGYTVYKPVTDGPHCFDNIAMMDKKECVIFEVKAKASRKYYPDTGFNHRHYKEYKAISEKHNMKVFMFFVDENRGFIYGGDLARIEKEIEIKHNNRLLSYPRIEGKIIYFPLSSMKNVKELSFKEVEYLKKYSNRNYDY